MQPPARGTVSPMPGQQTREEARVELWSVTFVDRDAGRAQGLDEAANEFEDLGLLAVREIACEFGAEELEQEGGCEGREDKVAYNDVLSNKEIGMRISSNHAPSGAKRMYPLGARESTMVRTTILADSRHYKSTSVTSSYDTSSKQQKECPPSRKTSHH